MVTVNLSGEIIKKLERLKREDESIEEAIERLIEGYEELEDYIEEKWRIVQRDKDKFIDLEENISLNN